MSANFYNRFLYMCSRSKQMDFLKRRMSSLIRTVILVYSRSESNAFALREFALYWLCI